MAGLSASATAVAFPTGTHNLQRPIISLVIMHTIISGPSSSSTKVRLVVVAVSFVIPGGNTRSLCHCLLTGLATPKLLPRLAPWEEAWEEGGREEGAVAWLGGEAVPCLDEEEARSAAIRRSSQARSFATEGCKLFASDFSGSSGLAVIMGIGVYSSLPPSPPAPRNTSRSTKRIDS